MPADPPPLILAELVETRSRRNRWLACDKAGVTCHALTYKGDDESIVAFVISHNLHRRHLSAGQRAAIAADLATMKAGARTDLVGIPTRFGPQISAGRATVCA